MRIFAAALLGWLSVCGLAAQTPAGQSTTTVNLPETPLLAAHAADLALGAKSDFNPTNLEMDSCLFGEMDRLPAMCPPLLRESGVTRVEEGIYSRVGGAQVTAKAWQFSDATGAYSTYTFLRTQLVKAHVTDGDARTGKAHETAIGSNGTLAWSSTAILWMDERATAPELAAAVAALPKVSGRAGLAPLLPTFEPAEGRDKGSERYAIGPVGYAAMGGTLPAEALGWGKSAEVLTTSYGRGTVTLMLYPTPQIAGDRGRAVEGYLNRQGATPGSIRMRRLGPLVGLATGLAPERAKALLDGLRLNQEVSFSEAIQPSFHAEIGKTYSLMQSIALFCGLGLVACVLLGLFLGGGRAGLRVLQGKPAATEPEFLAINLRNESRGVLLHPMQDGGQDGAERP